MLEDCKLTEKNYLHRESIAQIITVRLNVGVNY